MAETPASNPESRPDPVTDRARALVNKLWGDPELGAKVRKAAKDLFPDVSIPEDQVDPVIAPLKGQLEATQAELKALKEEREAEKRAAAEAATQRSLESALEAARKKYSLTDEGFAKMVERMKEKQNFTDAESAAAWVASETPPPKPTSGPSWTPQALDLYGSKHADEKFKLLHSDPDAFFDMEVKDILDAAAA